MKLTNKIPKNLKGSEFFKIMLWENIITKIDDEGKSSKAWIEGETIYLNFNCVEKIESREIYDCKYIHTQSAHGGWIHQGEATKKSNKKNILLLTIKESEHSTDYGSNSKWVKFQFIEEE